MNIRLRLATLAGLMFAFAAFGHSQITLPKPVGYVNDFDHRLSDQQRNTLESQLRAYKDNTGIEIAVVTLPSLQGQAIEDWGMQIAEQWGVGVKGSQSGLILIVAPNDHKYRVEVGYDLEGYITDGTAGELMRANLVPLTKQGKWGEGIIAGTNALIKELGGGAYKRHQQSQVATPTEDTSLWPLVIGLGLGSVAILALIIFWKRRKASEGFYIPEDETDYAERHPRIRPDFPADEPFQPRHTATEPDDEDTTPILGGIFSASSSSDDEPSTSTFTSSSDPDPTPSTDFSGFGGGGSDNFGGGGASGDC